MTPRTIDRNTRELLRGRKRREKAQDVLAAVLATLIVVASLAWLGFLVWAILNLLAILAAAVQ